MKFGLYSIAKGWIITKIKRWIAVLIALVLCLGILPPTANAAGDAMSLSAVKTLLNSVPLHPQITGYPALDALIEEILAPYEGADAYTQLKAAYDWIITQVTYSWAPYYSSQVPAYHKFNVEHNLEHIIGLQKVIPYDTANRAYHFMAYREGVCYDFASAFALFARYIGINSYVHTGWFTIEPQYGWGLWHHGWTILEINGKHYVFDAQRDHRLADNGKGTILYDYFGIASENAWRYHPETENNANRDAQFLSVTAPRSYHAVIETISTRSGTASGAGSYEPGSAVTLSASGTKEFLGWFNSNGIQLTSKPVYTFVAQTYRVFYAVFEDEYFFDIPANVWYIRDAHTAWKQGLIEGTAPFTFDGTGRLTRAMAVTLLHRMSGETAPMLPLPFSDVESNRWYTDAVSWGSASGVITGMNETTFAPDAPVTREQFITMLMRTAVHLGFVPEEAPLPYLDADKISEFARTAMAQAQSLGILNGYEDQSIRPKGRLTRAEGAVLLLRLTTLINETQAQ